MLAEGALTAIGAEKCRELVPFDTMYDIELAQRETEEATVMRVISSRAFPQS